MAFRNSLSWRFGGGVVPSKSCRNFLPSSSNTFLRSAWKKSRTFSVRHQHGGGAGIGNVQDQVLAQLAIHPTTESATRELYRHTPEPKTVSVIGAPMTFGQPFVGTDMGPTLLRESGLLPKLSAIGWRVQDEQDLDFSVFAAGDSSSSDSTTAVATTISSNKARNSNIVGRSCQVLADRVQATVRKGHFPLILGGDHSIGIGSLAGLLRVRPNLGVLWVDAHADLNTPQTSPSGNMHGMPIGLLMDGLVQDHASMPGFEWLASSANATPPPRLSPDSIVYVGLRDVDAEERATLRRLGIRAYTMKEVDHYGIGSVMDRAIQHLLQHDSQRPLHLSYDIDAVDPAHAPATGTAVRGGLTYREAHFVAEAAVDTGLLSSAELVEVNPSLVATATAAEKDGRQDTVDLALSLTLTLMGKSIL